MPYIDLVYIKSRVDDTLLARLTAETGSSDIDEDLIEARIDDAESIVNSKLSKRYNVPLSTAPSNIQQITYDIAIYFIYKLHRTHKMDEGIKFGYEEAIKQLNRIEDGKSNLIGVDEISSSPQKVYVNTNATSTNKKFSKEMLSLYR